MSLPVILIFDIGKTNKKVFLFNRQYQIVYEKCKQLSEATDEDGFPCEDVDKLTAWVTDSYRELLTDTRFKISGVNVSAYGASFVHLNNKNLPFLPIYNYLKPIDEKINKQFYSTYGSENKIAKETASPVLGNLNSGLQLYGLKHSNQVRYAQISSSLHLPQYIIYALCGAMFSDITSLGCHTALWDFNKHDYHEWVYKEEIHRKLAPLISSTEVIRTVDSIPFGSGMHDSSAALIPYSFVFREPFVLLSTGTWSISINPFNHTLLTGEELEKDCLCFLSHQGTAVKASRLFAGYEHEQQVKRMAAHYNVSPTYFNAIEYDAFICNRLQRRPGAQSQQINSAVMNSSPFSHRSLYDFDTCEDAYHQFMIDTVRQQIASTKLVMQDTVGKKIFVDGGFSKNNVYMNMLAIAFPQLEVYSAKVAQASAIGAAIALRKNWNDTPVPQDLITLKRFKPACDMAL